MAVLTSEKVLKRSRKAAKSCTSSRDRPRMANRLVE